jgi:hypothetical protein
MRERLVGSETGEDREMCGKKKVDNVGLGGRVQYNAANTQQHNVVQYSTVQTVQQCYTRPDQPAS